MDGLASLDAETVEQLSKWEGHFLHLNGLICLDAKTAEQLSKWNGFNLHLDGLTSIDAETVEQLSKWNGKSLWFNGLKEINPQAARLLAEWKGDYLKLNGLSELDMISAAFLAGGSVDLFDPKFHDIRVTIGPKAVTYALCLKLTELDEKTAKVLHAGLCPHITLLGLSKLDPSVEALLLKPKSTGKILCLKDT